MGSNTLINCLYHNAKRRAQRHNVLFTITKEHIFVPDRCPILGVKLVRGIKVSTDQSPTLDRVQADLGYIPGNILVVSSRANRIKSDASWAELRRIADFYEDFYINHWLGERDHEDSFN